MTCRLCDRPAAVRGWCRRHYQTAIEDGDLAADKAEASWAEVGAALGLSARHVQAIGLRALRRLRRVAVAAGLGPG